MSVERIPARRGEPVRITVDDRPLDCFGGETVAAALLAAGITAFNVTRNGDLRAPFCAMGTCFDCSVVVDGRPLIRACLQPVAEGMEVRTWQR